VIPDSVTTIGYSAFEGCSGLTGNLVIPDSVTTIGYSSFRNCSGLTGSLVIPDSVTVINNYAFYDCRGLTGNLVIPEGVTTIGNSAFSRCKGFTGALVIPDSVTTIGSSAFSSCSGLTGDLVIPDSVTTIGYSAFEGCSGLTGNLVIGDSVTTIGERAFIGCKGLTGNLVIPEGVTTIGEWAFYNCSGLTGDLVIGDSVRTIGNYTFRGCSGLTGIKVDENNVWYSDIDGVLLNKEGTVLLKYPEGKIGSYTIPSSVTAIGDYAFASCNGLTGNLVIPDSVTVINNYAFEYCSGLTGELVIGDSVTTIGSSAFSNCSGFTGDLVIPDSVTTIGDSAFSGCSGFNGKIVLPTGLTTIGFRMFFECSGLKGSLVIPEGVTEIGQSAFQNCRGLSGELVIPSSVVTIDKSAFYSCNFTGDLVIPDGVKTIGEFAFAFNNFTGALVIPESVTVIERYTFYNCSSLTEKLVISSNVTSIGENAFYNCSGLTGSLVIPSRVTTIGGSSFSGCIGLTTVVIPDSVTEIGGSAFNNCSGLSHAYFYGDVPSKWGVSVFSNNASDFIIHYIDGKAGWTSPTWISPDSFYHRVYNTAVFDPTIGEQDGFTYRKHDDKTATILSYSGTETDLAIPAVFNDHMGDYTAKAIGAKAFQNGASLRSVIIPASVQSIGDYAFENCTGLLTVRMENGVKTIGSNAFKGCSALASVSLSDQITSIGACAFYECKALAGEFAFPSGVKTISNCVLEGCAGLTAVVIPEGVTSIGYAAFSDCQSLVSVTIPDSVEAVGIKAFYRCHTLERAVLPGNLKVIESMLFYGCRSLSDILIPSSVTAIGDSAFYACKSLAEIRIPASVTEIGASAFKFCQSLSDIEIPASVSSIGNGAFAACSALQNAYFLGNVPGNWGGMVFDVNSSFTIHYLNGRSGWTTPEWTAPDSRVYKAEPIKPSFDEDSVGSGPVDGGTVSFKLFSLKVLDETNQNPIKGAEITFGGVTVKTDADGAAVFELPEAENVALSVCAEGFAAFSDEVYGNFNNHAFDIIQLHRQSDAVLLPISCNGKSISNSAVQINNRADLMAEIVVSGSSFWEITGYTLKQGYTVLGENQSGKFSVHNSCFKKNLPILVIMSVDGCDDVTEILNITVASFTFFPTDFPLGADTIKVPADVALFGGLELKIGGEKEQVEFEITNNQIKVGYNLNVKEKELSYVAKEFLNKKNYLVQQEATSNLSFDYAGYIVIDIGNNSVSNLQGQIFLVAKYSYEFGRTYILFLPIYVGIELSAEGQVIINRFGYDFDNAKLVWPSLDASIGGGVTLRGGASIWFASAGVYGSGKMNFLFGVLPKFMLKKWGLTGEFGLYARAKFLGEAKLPLVSGELVLYAPDRPSILSSIQMNGASLYDADLSEYSRASLSTGAWNAGVAAGTLQTDVGSFADPQIVTAGSTTLMVFLADNGGTDEYNYQQLVYSLWNGSGWDVPKAVDGNALSDAEYSLYSDGTSIYLAYTQAKRLMTSSDTASDCASLAEVAVTVFDAEKGCFAEPVVLTDDASFDTQPSLTSLNGSPVLVWAKNTDNNLFGMSENNALYISRLTDGAWTAPALLAEKTDAVMTLSIGSFDGANAVAAAVHDDDNDFTTASDSVLVLYAADGTTRSLPVGAYENAVFAESGLYWYENGTLSRLTSMNGEAETVSQSLSADSAADFDVIADEDNAYILYRVYNTEGENGGSDLYAITSTASGWTSPVRLTETAGYVDSFDAVWSDGALLTVYRRTDVTFTADSFDTTSDLCSALIRPAVSLKVTDITYDHEELFDDDQLTLTVCVTNRGTLPADAYTLTVGGRTETYAEPIASGETKELTVVCTIAEDTSFATVTVSDASGVSHSESIAVAFADFTVAAEGKLLGEKPFVNVTLRNEGSMSGSGTLSLKRDDADGKVIYSEKLTLDDGEQKYLLLEIVDGSLEKIFVEFTPDEPDYFEGDNSTACSVYRGIKLPAVTDAIALISAITSGETLSNADKWSSYDYDGDGSVTVLDVMELILVITEATA